MSKPADPYEGVPSLGELAERSDESNTAPRGRVLAAVENVPRPLYADVASLLAGDDLEPPMPNVLRRSDGISLFYSACVNVLFGDPESGKTWVALAALVEILCGGGCGVFIDLDHNGLQAVICRLIDLGAPQDALTDLRRFRYVEPEDKLHLYEVVADLQAWRPAVVVLDSVGELLPLMGLSSNSPDDFTVANTKVLKPLAKADAAVLAIDHLPKGGETRAQGQSGTAAKRRTIDGVSLRVEVNEQFAPGKEGSCFLNINKDRHGGLRRYADSSTKEPLARMFILDSSDPSSITWSIRPPASADAAKAAGVAEDDLATLDALDPPPKNVQDVKGRCRWRSERAANALREWRHRQKAARENVA